MFRSRRYFRFGSASIRFVFLYLTFVSFFVSGTLRPIPSLRADQPISTVPNERLISGERSSQKSSAVSKNVAVVCPLEYQAALKDWIRYRESQGFVVHLVTEPEPLLTADGRIDRGVQLQPTTTPERIRQKIRELNDRVPLSTLLLVGDGFPTSESPFGWRDVVPAPRVPAKIIQRFGDEDHIASDSWFADLDDDGFPDLSVGRFPVRSTEELIRLTRRIVDYETKIPPGNWQRRVNLIAGIGGFSPVVDHIVESTARDIFSELLSNDFELTLTQANWKSPYCPDPRVFRQTTIRRINEGALFWVYLGHGFYQGLDRLETPEGYCEILQSSDLGSIDCPFPPILLFCACYTGAFDAFEDSLAERIILGENAPIAALAASRTSEPYGMAIFGAETLRELFGSRSDSTTFPPRDVRLGELVFAAKKRMIQKIREFAEQNAASEIAETARRSDASPTSADSETPKQKSSLFSFQEKKDVVQRIDDVAKIFDPYPKRLGDQLEDHLHLFNLFGDPLLKIRLPQEISLDAPEITYSTYSIPVSGSVAGFRSKPSPETADSTPMKTSPLQKTTEISPAAVDRSESFGATENPLTAQIELVLPRNRSPVRKPNRKTFSLSPEATENYRTVYAAANQPVVKKIETPVRDGEFSVGFEIPENVSGRYILRVYIEDQSNVFVGSRELTVRPFDPTAVRPSAYYEEEVSSSNRR